VHLKRKDKNQIQVATLKVLRAPVGLTDPVPSEVPGAPDGRVTSLLPSYPNAPSPQEPPGPAAPWQEQSTGQEHMTYLTAIQLSPACLLILADIA